MSTTFSLSMEISKLTRGGTAELVSRDQILRHKPGQGNIHFPLLADHMHDWQPYPVDPYSCYMLCDHTYLVVRTCRIIRLFMQCVPLASPKAQAPGSDDYYVAQLPQFAPPYHHHEEQMRPILDEFHVAHPIPNDTTRNSIW